MTRRRDRGGGLSPIVVLLVCAAGLGGGAGLAYFRWAAAGTPQGPSLIARPAPVPPRSAVPRPPAAPSRDAPGQVDLAARTRAIDQTILHALDAAGVRLIFRASPRRERGDEPARVRWPQVRADARLPQGMDAPAVLRALQQAVARHGGDAVLTGRQVQVTLPGSDGERVVTHVITLLDSHTRALVAVIFDDAGATLEELEPIVALGRPAAVAVLPGLRFSRELARRARQAGLEVLLHLPVEPESTAKNPGPGAVLTSMDDDQIRKTVRQGILEVPGARGVNNHMGSRGTSDPRVMRVVLEVVRERGLFFVDSVTSGRSLALRTAQEMGIPAAARQVFLDNEDDPDRIRLQIHALARVALERGQAVAIGHVRRHTATVLRAMLSELEAQGIELVPVSALVR
ncbi:MAG: divergent polysaccharide deacetylase family protein [Armatimonadetes bacterium]|nr:divergent polysaccharide deacetylase family protein [Armatimonadota bacterium]